MSLSSVSLQQLAPTRLFRWVETASIVGAALSNVWLAYEVACGMLARQPGGLSLIGAVVAAYLVSDLLAGVVHFVGDSFGSVDTPWLGLTFVLPFRSHHVRPEDICRHDFVATNGNNAFATLFVLVPTLIWWPTRSGGAATAVGLFVCVLSVLLSLTNQIHKWAHVPRPPTWVKQLQRAGVLLSPERHRAHHRPPYAGGYCVTSGLCNRVLDPLGLFPALERGIRRVLRRPRKTA